MKQKDLSITRKFLLWYLKQPQSPYVSYNFTVDFSNPREYLKTLQEETQKKISIQHLVSATIARVYKQFPVANSSVVGHKIFQHPHVGVGVPIDLTESESPGEIGFSIIAKAEEQTLMDLAQSTRSNVNKQREGGSNKFMKAWMPYTKHIPQRLLSRTLSSLDLALQNPWFFKKVHPLFPVTVLVSNPGAKLSLPMGTTTEGASFSFPQKLMGLGSFLGVFPVEEKVVALDGKAVVRPVLPFVYFFDHRLFDGAMCGKILSRFSEILQNPEREFGKDGLKK